jgi:hypothetical protein
MNFFKNIVSWLTVRKDWANFVVPVFTTLFLSATASAQIDTGIPPLADAAGATRLLCNIFDIMFWILISVSIIMAMWGAWLYMMAGEDEKRPSEARMTILYALIGVAIAFGAKGFPLLIASIFPGSSVSKCP